MCDIESLKRQRTTLKGRATRFKTFIETQQSSADYLLNIRSRLEKFDELWKEYHALQTNIDALLPEADYEEREGFEDAFFAIQTLARRAIAIQHSDNRAISPTGEAANGQSANQSMVRLPVISLPVFSGSYETWQQFYDTFIALVDKNEKLNAVQKFHYLTSALSGAAAQVIHSLQITNENYAIALELLQERFQNIRLTIHHHVHELFNLTPVAKESAELLRALLDNCQKHLRVLKQLKEPTDQWGTLIIYLITSKLDVTSKKEWERKVIQDKLSTVRDLTDFLNERCQYLEALNPTPLKIVPTRVIPQRANYAHSSQKRESATVSHVATSGTNECILCNQTHRIYSCNVFKNLTIDSRRNEAKRLNLCYNCLGSNHSLKDCTSRGCKHCSKKHHSLLHAQEQPNAFNHLSGSSNDRSSVTKPITSVQSDRRPENTTPVSINAAGTSRRNHEVLLSTAIVYLRDNSGRLHKARALLDNGSQSNIIKSSLCQRLRLKVDSSKHTISGLNVAETHVTTTTKTKLFSTDSNYETDVNFLVVDQITRSIPIRPINIKNLRLPSDLDMADPNFHTPQDIDLLLGAAIFWDILGAERIQLGGKQPILQSTKLGWLLCGEIATPANQSTHRCHIFCGLVRHEDLQAQLEKFWRVEDMPDPKRVSKEESKCEEVFRNEYTRTDSGRFQVALPFREDPSVLGESKSIAFKRLTSMERRFKRSPELQLTYAKFMDDYIDLGHMTALPEHETTNVTYLPHHSVLKESSTSTKLRVVFDASCSTASGKSLNDVLMVGPTIQQELFEILLRFRQHLYVLTADIVKMYRQVLIKPEHRKYQCILWRNNPEQPATTFRLDTVTYGVASAPFLAIRSLQQLAHDFQETHPHASTIIRRDFYVDDLITGESSPEDLLETKNQVTNVLRSGGFELAKFRSNLPLCRDECLTNYELSDTKVLGLLWQSTSDLLYYQANCDVAQDLATKRSILSVITQIFDPLGLIGPVTIKAKILMQVLWQQGIDWDSPLPETLRISWSSYYRQLTMINQIAVPRHAVIPDSVQIQLHGFCDASQTAYGACVYLRSVDNAGRICVRLLTGKSRVAPLKSLSLPRLELCGATLLAKLLQKVLQALTCKISEHYLWTDSTIVLAWIRGEPSQWQTFVGNRIAEIQQHTNKLDWKHVRSEHNPADVISRGLLPEQLINNTIWWEGPPWMKNDCTEWTDSTPQVTDAEIPERRVQTYTFLHVRRSFDVIDQYSSLRRLKRVVAFCLRFATNCKLATMSTRVLGPLTTEELQGALNILIKLHQENEFSSEMHDLRKKRTVNSHSKLHALNPFIDEDGVLRVGGRLKNAPLPYTQKYPVILSPRTNLTELIIRDQHSSHFHIGPQLLLTTLRQRYWIVNAKTAIKRVLSKCVLCFRMRPRSPVQIMGDLPAYRVTPSRAFKNTGVDYAGPFNIKVSRNKSGKAYLALFVCMATKAVHLELVSDLTTEVFLNALKRFISRRGKCTSISSDNGKNFLGASNVLKTLGELLSNSKHQSNVIDFATNQGIEWKFIPPHSPHMGGLWEAGVKAVKAHLKAVISETLLSFEELYTVFTQIEAILNSRPLCPLTNEPDELEVLTPGHFLIGTSLLALPEESVVEVPVNRTNRFQLLTQLQQSFWRRWSREYVLQLQHRSKWKSVVRNDEIQIGKLALIRDENLPPLKWRTGRICAVHPNADGLIRVVSLKTTGGIIQRSLPKICILPID